MQRLTKAEEEIMQLFWEKGASTVSQLIETMDLPKPPHSTVSTIVRILEKKGFLDHAVSGRSYVYRPLVAKHSYSRFSLRNIVSQYFGGSMNELVSFLVKEDDLSLSELESIRQTLLKEEE